MSNPSTPFGFEYFGLVEGTSPNFGVKTVQISPSNTNSIYGGDVAKVISGGYYDVAAEIGGGAAIGGVFLPDFIWQSKSQQMTVRSRAWLGATNDIVAGGILSAKLVISRDALFKVRSNGSSGAAVAQTNVGNNVNFAVGSTPGNNLISSFSIDDSVLGSGASLPFTVYSIVQQPESDPTALYNIVLVRFNNLTII